MSLLGPAAMLLFFDINQQVISEHDDWHTHEHLPERLSIPGFLRGSRWLASGSHPRYFVIYEVQNLGILSSEAYLERLNNPSSWTSKMMPHYRGMARGFCSVTGNFGFGIGHISLLIRFRPKCGAEPSLREWLIQNTLPKLPTEPGLGSAVLLESAETPRLTHEQQIRGVDTGVDWTVFISGYRQDVLKSITQAELSREQLEKYGATDVITSEYNIDYSLIDRECLSKI